MRRRVVAVLLYVLAVLAGQVAGAGPVSLLDEDLFGTGGQPVLALGAGGARRAGEGAAEAAQPVPALRLSSGASLFAGRREGSLFAPWMPRRAAAAMAGAMEGGAADAGGFGPVARLRALIGRAEAGVRGYDAVQYGARIAPPRPPTQMTLGEIYDWIEATPGQPHAIGYYQFIPPTLKRLAAQLGAGPDTVFSPEFQDRMGDILLAEAGLHRMARGEIDRHTFMLNLGKIWAGLPNTEGRSHYEGIAGNKASFSWEVFDEEMARIFPG